MVQQEVCLSCWNLIYNTWWSSNIGTYSQYTQKADFKVNWQQEFRESFATKFKFTTWDLNASSKYKLDSLTQLPAGSCYRIPW